MYLVTRADLTPAQQAVQAAHAAVRFTARHKAPPDETIVLLAARGEMSLHAIMLSCEVRHQPYAGFYEPDLGDQLTAVAFTGEPSAAVRRLPLALQEEAMPILRSRKPVTTATADPALAQIAALRIKHTETYAQLMQMTAERDALAAQLEGNIPKATAWLQTKVWRMRTHLDRIERTVRAQRLELRFRNEHDGRRPTREEWEDILDAQGDQWLHRLPRASLSGGEYPLKDIAEDDKRRFALRHPPES